MVSSTAFLKAANLTRILASLSEDPYPQTNQLLTTFKDGTCLAAVRNAEVFKATPQSVPAVRGNLGVAMLPGTTEVLDRASGELVPCTASTCSDTATLANGSTTPLNRW